MSSVDAGECKYAKQYDAGPPHSEEYNSVQCENDFERHFPFYFVLLCIHIMACCVEVDHFMGLCTLCCKSRSSWLSKQVLAESLLLAHAE